MLTKAFIFIFEGYKAFLSGFNEPHHFPSYWVSIFSSLVLDKLEHMDTQTGLDIDSTISKLQSKIFGAYLVMNSWSV